MKKKAAGILCLVLALIMAGCGSTDTETTGTKEPDVIDVLKAYKEANERKKIREEEAKEMEEAAATAVAGFYEQAPLPSMEGEYASVLSETEGIDIDLTFLSYEMSYAEVYAMMVTPDSYIGKTIQMHGPYNMREDENGDQHYFCLVDAATSCCPQGIEFKPSASYVYPDDYPEEGGFVTVRGEFAIYEKDGSRYAYLNNADMVIEESE